MSALVDRSFRQAILNFNYAREFIGCLSDGAHNIAEDIFSDMMAKSRKDKDAQGDFIDAYDHQAGLNACYSKLSPAFLVIQMSLLEDCLLDLCEATASEKHILFRPPESGHFTAEHARSFFQDTLGIQLPSPWTALDKIMDFQNMRDLWANNHSMITGNFGLTDLFFLELNNTIIRFIEELRDHYQDAF